MGLVRMVIGTASVMLTAMGVLLAPNVMAAEPLRIGVVTFMSGPVSGPVGVPSRNGAEVIIDAINAGSLPAPYDGQGIGGRQIESEYVDEAVEPLNEYRNLVTRSGVDVVVGYASSGSCVSIAPEADALKTLTIFYYCGSTRIFEEAGRDYVFRTMNSQDVENIAAARYVLDRHPDIERISGINQNYGWGQNSWRDFAATLAQLKPSIEVATEQFPQIFAGQYGAEITALDRAKADVVHTSFWGGDLDAFLLQAAPRGLLRNQIGVLTTGGTAFASIADQIPDGTVIGVRGNGGVLSTDSEFNDWFRAAYDEKYGETPTFPAYYMAQAVLALKAAGDAAAQDGGAPSVDEIRAALQNIEYAAPAGVVRLARHDGHQAATDIAYAEVQRVDGKPTLANVVRYSPECVIAPVGVASLEWINAGFPGAECD